MLEMPSGTGKTVSLLSLIVAYQQYYPEKRKLVYCSRKNCPPRQWTSITDVYHHFSGTMSEIEKALAELKALMKYRSEQLGYEEDFRGLGLTSRKNLCLHPSVKREKSGTVVDARCRSLTAGFVKEKKERGENVDLCVYHDVRYGPLLVSTTLTLAEPRPSRSSRSHTERRMDLRWPFTVWRTTQTMPIFHSPPDGKLEPASKLSLCYLHC